MVNIWLVEDEITIADTLIYKLESEHYQVRWFDRGELMLQALKTTHRYPNLLILDVGLPDMIGFELAKIVLAKHDIPIVFLTARNEEIDRIVGLEIGADDYIAKPLSPREVLARVKAILRRYGKSKLKSPHILSKHLQAGPFILDEEYTTVSYYEKPLNLTCYEYLLLKTLIKSPNRVFS